MDTKKIEELQRRGSSFEIYKSVAGFYSWRVIVATQDESEQAVRAAKALALELENELAQELHERVPARKGSR